ncbi:hypothetical protein DdX_02513 [Ditylenchus destructor]|uniref:Uncharacterized protein n=1 Tax=Ditylenchus destructor TaxID=166010 RepID=A0AAD4NGA5_9BILA|nr:hypothetical protein DdX_02513 [Ditylenchus destructor]
MLSRKSFHCTSSNDSLPFSDLTNFTEINIDDKSVLDQYCKTDFLSTTPAFDDDLYGYENVFGYDTNLMEADTYKANNLEALRPILQNTYRNLLEANPTVPPMSINQIINQCTNHFKNVLHATKQDILENGLKSQNMAELFAFAEEMINPDQSFKIELHKMIEAQKHPIEIKVESPMTLKVKYSDDNIQSEAQLTKSAIRKRRTVRKSNSTASSSGSISHLFDHLNVENMFRRSADGEVLWQEFEENRYTNEYMMEPRNVNPKPKTKLFVRILGYALMDIEKRIARLITAAERRQFLQVVADQLPVKINLDIFANSTSKGMLDMFIRNKRHYQARAYGISLSVPKIKSARK